MNKLTKVETLYVPVSVNDELPDKEDCYFVFTKGIEEFEDDGTDTIKTTEFTHCGWHRFVNTFQGKYFSSLPKNENVTHWLKEQNNKYILSEEELRTLIKKIIWSDDWDRTIHNLFNNIEDNNFYCYDKCVANAEEDYDFKKCTVQCDKCKEE